MNEQESTLVLRDPQQVETAYLAAKLSESAPLAEVYLHTIVSMYPPGTYPPSDVAPVQLLGETAKVIKQEIIDSLESVAYDQDDTYPHLTVAAVGLLKYLQGEEEEAT